MKRLSQKIETHAKLMGKMMDRCDVDLQRLAADRLGLTLASAVRTCARCRNADSCRGWLAATAGETKRQPPSFCPNAVLFDKMTRLEEEPQDERLALSSAGL
ncbi:DUF6455 family protein (plasmid) [Nitratireductor sp. GZWM139]|nr:DUF6455 family protein [Nitratireductor sp. GZWM139]